MTSPYRAMIARMADELDHYRQLLMDDRREAHALATEARALLAQPVAEERSSDGGYEAGSMWAGHPIRPSADERTTISNVAEGPSASDVTELFYRHMGEGSEVGFENAIEEALARWGRPTPPAEGEVAEVAAWLRLFCSEEYESRSLDPDFAWLTRAAELLGHPTPQPVAISERLPGPEDCIFPTGECWWFDSHADGAWYVDTFQGNYTHWLPANALPTPEATND